MKNFILSMLLGVCLVVYSGILVYFSSPNCSHIRGFYHVVQHESKDSTVFLLHYVDSTFIKDNPNWDKKHTSGDIVILLDSLKKQY